MTPASLPDWAVGFIDWLDPLLHPFLAAAILVTNVNECTIKVSLEAYNCDDLRIACLWIVPDDDLVAAVQKPLAL